ncbi:MAG: hypothetical protein ACHQQS_15945 [Thermoanaerobaculales bacterium]
MRWPLSLPVLLVLAWGIAGLLWLDRRHPIPRDGVPWTMAALALVAIAMGILLVGQAAPVAEELVRVTLLAEGVWGFCTLARRAAKRPDDGRR